MATMSKLEEAVLSGDTAAVDALLEKYGTSEFEVASRALAYAAYLVGCDMTKVLLQHGVTFEYAPGPADLTRNECWFRSPVPLDFARLLFLRFRKMASLDGGWECCAMYGRRTYAIHGSHSGSKCRRSSDAFVLQHSLWR